MTKLIKLLDAITGLLVSFTLLLVVVGTLYR
jgi:hypothetical protein